MICASALQPAGGTVDTCGAAAPGPALLTAFPHSELSIERLPWVTWSLALVWTLTWIGGALGLDPVALRLGVDPVSLSAQGFAAYWLFTSGFLHWAVSVTLLLALGAHLEDSWGLRAFAGFVLAGAAVAAGVYAFAGEDGRPLVGASPVVTALLASMLMRGAMGSLRWHVAAGGSQEISFELPVLALAGVWFVGEVLMTATSSGVGTIHGTGVTTLCGAAFGVGGTMLLRRLDIDSGAAGGGDRRAHPALIAAQDARDAGRPHAALSALEPAVRSNPHDAELVRALCDAACEANEAGRAAEPMRKLVAEQVKRGEASAAAAFWRAFGPKVPGVRLDPRTAIELAVALSAATEKALAARVLRDTLASSPRLGPGVAMRMCEVAAPLHRETAIRAGKMALAAEGLDEAKRSKLAARIAALEAEAPRPGEEPLLDDPKPAGRPGAAALASKPLDRVLDVELDPDYAPIRPSELPPPPPREVSFELSADGSKVEGENSDGDFLSAPLPETVDPEEAAAAAAEAERAAEAARVAEVARAAQAAREAEAAARMEAAAASEREATSIGASVAAGETRFHELKVIEAVPESLDESGLALRDGPHVDLSRVDAIGVAGVQGMAAKPVLLIDLLMNWSELGDGPLRTVRLRSDHFDPRALFPASGGGLDAFRALVAALIERTGATPLPDAASASGKPFKMFPDLARYEREVLQVER
jgi:membrane associated rhomboid family serine protease